MNQHLTYKLVLTLALCTPWLSAWGDTIDNFETYNNTAEMLVEWTASVGIPPPTITLDTTTASEGSQSMRMAGTLGSLIPAMGATYDFDTAQDWSTATSFSLWYKGNNTNASMALRVNLLNSGGGGILFQDVSNATRTNVWTKMTIAFTGQAGLNDVKTIQVAMFFGVANDGAVMNFDDLQVTFPVIDASIVVTETGGSTDVTEGGANDTVDVQLDAVPTANVVVTPSFVTTQLNVTPVTHTITPGIGTNPVTFTVSADNDAFIEGDHSSTLSFSTSSGDGNFDGLSTSNLVVSITDDDFLIQPIVSIANPTETNFQISVETVSVQQYILQSNPNLDTNWVNISGAAPGNLFNPAVFTVLLTNDMRNYRILTEPNTF